VKTGLELISSHKKHQFHSKENFMQFNNGSPLGRQDDLPFGNNEVN
jgi:hypothetical protein